GIGAGFIPSILDTSLLDGTIQVEKNEAFDFARRVVREEGVFMGISSGASLAAVGKLLERVDRNSTILTFNYDTGERYLSVNDLF
ncbi:MAG: pyridoxal-phosphate dependent enzyme, partial [Bacteroidetes bacterium]